MVTRRARARNRRTVYAGNAFEWSVSVEGVPEAPSEFAGIRDLHPPDLVQEAGIVVVRDEHGTDVLTLGLSPPREALPTTRYAAALTTIPSPNHNHQATGSS